MNALAVPLSPIFAVLCALFATSAGFSEKTFTDCKTLNPAPGSFHDFKANLLNGTEVQFSQFKNKERFSNGTCDFEIATFPCHQFGREEPGKNEYEILNGLKYVRPGHGYVASFPIFEKNDVNGVNETDIYTFLKNRCPSPAGFITDDTSTIFWSPIRNNDISWNFEKILIDHEGQPFRRYSSPTLPLELEEDVQHLMYQCRQALTGETRPPSQQYWY